MSGYKEHLEKQLAAKADAENKAKADAIQKKERQAASLVDGKAWLEQTILPELQEAKSDLDGHIRIDFSNQVTQRQLKSGMVNEVTFTVNPWESRGGFRSHIFAICTGEDENAWIEARQPSEDGWGDAYKVVGTDQADSFHKIKAADFQKYLKGRIDSVLSR
ncbi:hypothetical protein [Mesorhizobium sp. M0701]|uniref:hypothetical protein n=1 Tax=Mesorhizobium sp. M0701 TaxID=2956989 RepID=UPI00333BE833